MEDILVLENNSIEESVIDETEFKDNQFSDSDFGSDKSLDEDVLKGEESIDEFKQIDKSVIFIPNGNAINYNINTKSINLNDYLSGFDKELLWENSNYNSSFGQSTINLNNSFVDYDFILFNIKAKNTDSEFCSILIPTENLLNNNICYFVLGNRSAGVNNTRFVEPNSNNSFDFSNAFYVNGSGFNNNYNIPISIYGLKFKSLSINENPVNPLPSISGNNIYYNYNIYCDGVSENAVSWNLINKPINEYNVQESFMLLSFTFALCISLYLLIRKAVFKWR